MATVSLCPEVRALKVNEKGVVDSLENVDKERLKCLCREAVEIRVIPQDVKNSLESMDWENVPHPTVIRYLLMHVYKSIEDNLMLYERWLELLQKYLPSTAVLDKINEILALIAPVLHHTMVSSAESPLSADIMRLAEGIGEDILQSLDETSSMMSGTKRPIVHDIILARHISIIANTLAPQCASKWDSICTALYLPDSVRQDLHLKQMTYGSCTPCFTHLLTVWVLGGYEHAKAPTLENLEEALRSEIVGRGTEANKLQDINLFGVEQPPLSKKPRLEPPPLEIVRQSCDTIVSDGKSTLLEIQAVTSQDADISYKWVKDGCQLNEGHYNNVICVTNANLSSKGAYKCEVSIHDGSTTSVISEPILLEVSISPIKMILVDRYTTEPEVPEDSWPPVSSNTYINLALIKQGSLDMTGEYARKTVQGNVDDILTDKESIEYENTFTNLENTTRLLIEGRPGSGKTTLVHKFSQDWARGSPQLNLHNIKLLFLVHLRGFFNDQNIKLCDIVRLYYPDDSMVDEVIQKAKESNGEGFCFILDGLDEYRPKSMKNRFIYKLIKRQVLPKAVVIVASRPAASSQFRSIASKQVEVIGFLKEQILEYVEEYPFSEPGKRKDLHEYLEQHPNVYHMCYLPIHAAMVCYLFDIMGSTLPRTETEMYKEFTNLTLIAHFET